MTAIGPKLRTEDFELALIERRVEAEGLCTDGTRDPEGWFPPKTSRPRDVADQRLSLALASRQCSSELFGPCPVRELCALAAMARGEAHGIWGGLPAWVLRGLRNKSVLRLRAMFRRADEAAAELLPLQKTTETKHDTTSASHPRLAA